MDQIWNYDDVWARMGMSGMSSRSRVPSCLLAGLSAEDLTREEHGSAVAGFLRQPIGCWAPRFVRWWWHFWHRLRRLECWWFDGSKLVAWEAKGGFPAAWGHPEHDPEPAWGETGRLEILPCKPQWFFPPSASCYVVQWHWCGHWHYAGDMRFDFLGFGWLLWSIGSMGLEFRPV